MGPTEQEPVDDKPLNIVVMFPSISIVHNIGNRAVRNLGAGGQSPLHPQILDRIEAEPLPSKGLGLLLAPHIFRPSYSPVTYYLIGFVRLNF